MAGSPAAGVRGEKENNHKRREREREGSAAASFRKPLSVCMIIILIIRTPSAIDLPIRLI